jgi:sigma-B regulation protein RsbU (phosphoserine phosphatase)
MSHKNLFRKIERTLASIEKSEEIAETIVTLARAIVENFERELGISGGRLYRRNEGRFELVEHFGKAKPVEKGVSVPADYPPILIAMEEGVVVGDENDPGTDRAFEREIGVRRFAAIEVGDGNHLLAFDVSPDGRAEEIRPSLQIFRLAINQRVRAGRLEELLYQARSIQQSILPKKAPETRDYEMAGRSDPAELVGGDFYDFLPISDKITGIAIADASGHGLPAALQVRDVYMGLRMGVERDIKIVRTVERLNQIIQQSHLVTKFVSLFFGELEPDGLFIYVNAGHNPPLHVRTASSKVDELTSGGMVLGLSPGATYQRGFTRIQPGDLLALYTDGIIETRNPKGEEYGTKRLVDAVRRFRAAPVEEIVAQIFASVERFSGGALPEDDRTFVVIRRRELPGPAASRPA